MCSNGTQYKGWQATAPIDAMTAGIAAEIAAGISAIRNIIPASMSGKMLKDKHNIRWTDENDSRNNNWITVEGTARTKS